MNANHKHQWVFGKGFRVCDQCAKVVVGLKTAQDNKQVLMEMN